MYVSCYGGDEECGYCGVLYLRVEEVCVKEEVVEGFGEEEG